MSDLNVIVLAQQAFKKHGAELQSKLQFVIDESGFTELDGEIWHGLTLGGTVFDYNIYFDETDDRLLAQVYFVLNLKTITAEFLTLDTSGVIMPKPKTFEVVIAFEDFVERVQTSNEDAARTIALSRLYNQANRPKVYIVDITEVENEIA